MRALVVGGGIGGLAAAVALARSDIEVRVYEQAARLAEVGAGVVLTPNSLRLLDRLGLGTGIFRLGVRLTDSRLCRADGQPAAHRPDQFARPGQLVGMHRADLLALLADSLPDGAVRTGHRCTGFGQDDDRAVVTFGNGESAEADVVIGADGIHSVLQEHVAEPAAPIFSGVIAHRGVIGVPPGWPAATMRMWVGEGKHFLAFGVRAGQLLNFVGFVSSGTQLRESWSAPGDQGALAAEFADWDPVITTIIDAIGSAGFRWGLYDRAPLRRWSHGRLTLLGDAAHPMLPHLGQGANQAIEDAAALAVLLSAVDPPGVSRALAAYQELRLDRTAQVQLGSRRNGAGYDSSGAQLQSRGWIYDYDVEAAAAPAVAALRGA